VTTSPPTDGKRLLSHTAPGMVKDGLRTRGPGGRKGLAFTAPSSSTASSKTTRPRLDARGKKVQSQPRNRAGRLHDLGVLFAEEEKTSPNSTARLAQKTPMHLPRANGAVGVWWQMDRAYPPAVVPRSRSSPRWARWGRKIGVRVYRKSWPKAACSDFVSFVPEWGRRRDIGRNGLNRVPDWWHLAPAGRGAWPIPVFLLTTKG